MSQLYGLITSWIKYTDLSSYSIDYDERQWMYRIWKSCAPHSVQDEVAEWEKFLNVITRKFLLESYHVRHIRSYIEEQYECRFGSYLYGIPQPSEEEVFYME